MTSFRKRAIQHCVAHFEIQSIDSNRQTALNKIGHLTLNRFYFVSKTAIKIIIKRGMSHRTTLHGSIRNAKYNFCEWREYSVRGTQQTVSVNICSEDPLSPTIFGLKYDEKLEFSLAQIFVEKVIPIVFGEIKCRFR